MLHENDTLDRHRFMLSVIVKKILENRNAALREHQHQKRKVPQ